MRSALLAALGVAALSSPALAEPPKPAAPTVSELVVEAAKTVSELTVTAAQKCLRPASDEMGPIRPRVVSTFPARNAVVKPGLVVIRLTFDQPMACEGRLEDTGSAPNPCPDRAQTMVVSFDRRTIRTVCLVDPAMRYGFSIGQHPMSYTFRGMAGGLPVEPARIAFSTTDDPPLMDVCQALMEDPETAADMRRRGLQDCPAAKP
jgi:hypothetical protein